MNCPQCDEPLATYALGERESFVCEDCGYVGIEAEHRGEPRRVESWTDALRRFYAAHDVDENPTVLVRPSGTQSSPRESWEEALDRFHGRQAAGASGVDEGDEGDEPYDADTVDDAAVSDGVDADSPGDGDSASDTATASDADAREVVADADEGGDAAADGTADAEATDEENAPVAANQREETNGEAG